eukprot:PhM_4_TR14862/c0_g1_i1/m.86553
MFPPGAAGGPGGGGAANAGDMLSMLGPALGPLTKLLSIARYTLAYFIGFLVAIFYGVMLSGERGFGGMAANLIVTLPSLAVMGCVVHALYSADDRAAQEEASRKNVEELIADVRRKHADQLD